MDPLVHYELIRYSSKYTKFNFLKDPQNSKLFIHNADQDIYSNLIFYQQYKRLYLKLHLLYHENKAESLNYLTLTNNPYLHFKVQF